MKVSSINTIYKNQSVQQKTVLKTNNFQNTPCAMTVNDSISFGIANSEKLKVLFQYGLPCMYSGTEMIDPRKFGRMMKKNCFNSDARTALNNLKLFSKSFNGKEKRIYLYLKFKSIFKNYKNIQEELLSLKPYFEQKLVKQQKPVLKELEGYAEELPKKYQGKYNLLLSNSYKKIDNEPITLKFSQKEFIYKLVKAKEDFKNTYRTADEEAIIDMLRISSNFYSKTKKIAIRQIYDVYENSSLKGNLQVKKILDDAKIRIYGKPLKINFTRKSFIYDVMKLIEPIKNQNLKDKILRTALKLPHSSNSFEAYIVKISNESSDKIAYRLAWPTFASVEHIHPKSLGGKDEMNNFGGATTKENSERQNIDFTEQLKRRPDTQKYSQKYINKLLLLNKKGIFKKHNIDPIYINDFAQAVTLESKGQIQLTTKEPWYYRFI